MAKNGSLLPMIMAITGKRGQDEDEGDSEEGALRDAGGENGDEAGKSYSIDHSHMVELMKHGKTTMHHEDGSSAQVGCDYSKADKHFDAGMKGFKDAYEKSRGGESEPEGAIDDYEEEDEEKPAMSGGREVSR